MTDMWGVGVWGRARSTAGLVGLSGWLRRGASGGGKPTAPPGGSRCRGSSIGLRTRRRAASERKGHANERARARPARHLLRRPARHRLPPPAGRSRLAALAPPVRLKVFPALVVAGPAGMTPGVLVRYSTRLNSIP